ncbi:MAG: glycosyltransferase family 2 protein [Rhodobacteraceae bacterium]|nr:glycosyltransferase family 2 protein [Paracoccaceae bacterium]
MIQGKTYPDAPVFSVIVPVHNAAQTLPATLNSLRAQSFENWEAILVDDASSDGSLAILQRACIQDPRMRLLHDPAQKRARQVAATRNLGLAQARGDFVAFLDADDRWLPEKLAAQLRAFDQGADIVFSSYRRVDENGLSKGVVRAEAEVTWETALSGNPIGCSTGAYRRTRFAQARMPVDMLPEDYVFWLSLMREGGVAVGLSQVLAEYRVSPGSRSANKLASAIGVWRVLGQQEIGLLKRLRGFSGYMGASVMRRLASR